MPAPPEPAIIAAVRNKLYVIGYPLGHTLSPKLHSSYFAKMKLSLSYEAREMPPGKFTQSVKEMLSEYDFLGCNVTAPYKQSVVPFLDELKGDAEKLGTVNTIVYKARKGILAGYNTDAGGFSDALRASGRETVRRALIFGTGGAALAVILALADMGCSRFVIVHRSGKNLDAARKLVSSLGKKARFFNLSHFRDFFKWAEEEDIFGDPGGYAEMELAQNRAAECAVPASANDNANADSESYDKGPKRFDLLVNATPTGLHPRAEDAIADHPRFFHLFDAVMDLVYNPAQTKLLFLAQLEGCETISGRKMLQCQAVRSRKIWVREFRAGEKLKE